MSRLERFRAILRPVPVEFTIGALKVDITSSNFGDAQLAGGRIIFFKG